MKIDHHRIISWNLGCCLSMPIPMDARVQGVRNDYFTAINPMMIWFQLGYHQLCFSFYKTKGAV